MSELDYKLMQECFGQVYGTLDLISKAHPDLDPVCELLTKTVSEIDEYQRQHLPAPPLLQSV